MKRLRVIIVALISLIAVTSLIVVTIVLLSRQRLKNKIINIWWYGTTVPETWYFQKNNKLSIEFYDAINSHSTGSYKIISGNSLEACNKLLMIDECYIFENIRINEEELLMYNLDGDQRNFSSIWSERQAPTDKPEPSPSPTPPPGATSYYHCAFTVYVPAELTIADDDFFWGGTFTPTSNPNSSNDETVWVHVRAGEKPGIDLETAFAQAVDEYGLKGLKDPDEHAVTALNYVSNSVPGIQSDYIIGEEHYRVLVFVRPDTCFGDYAPTEVVYTIVAEAPVDSWETWEPIFDVIFQSIEMKNCWGI